MGRWAISRGGNGGCGDTGAFFFSEGKQAWGEKETYFAHQGTRVWAIRDKVEQELEPSAFTAAEEVSFCYPEYFGYRAHGGTDLTPGLVHLAFSALCVRNRPPPPSPYVVSGPGAVLL